MINEFTIDMVRTLRQQAILWSALLTACLTGSPASAATYTWTNGSGNRTWDTTLLNWTQGAGDVAWISSNDAVFGSTGVGTVTVTGTQTITSATFTAPGYTITGGQLTLGSATTTIAVPTGSDTITIASVLGGSNRLAKTGSGTLVLTSSNSLSGQVNLNGGTLAVGHDRALGSGGINFANNSAVFRSADASSRTISNALTLTNSITFGSTDTGNLLLTGNVTGGSGGTRTITINNALTEFSGNYSASNSQIKAGPGVLVLSASNTAFAGTMTISAGVLRIASSGRLNNSIGLTINGAMAELNYNASVALTTPITFTQGILSGTGAIGTAVTVAANDTLSPGNSPGSQSFTAGLTWDPGGTYRWEINDAAGSAGVNWDQLSVSGAALNLSGLSTENKFLLDLATLSGTTTGPMANYVVGQSYAFPIATYSSLTLPTGFSGDDLTSLFQIGTSGWLNPLPAAGDISVVNDTTTNTINLVIVPEPSALGLLSAAAVMATASWLRRRR